MSQSRRFRPQHDDLFPRSSGPVPAVTVFERLALSLRALGAAGEAWLAGLPGLLADLEADWSVTVGAQPRHLPDRRRQAGAAVKQRIDLGAKPLGGGYSWGHGRSSFLEDFGGP
jgi:hypothetical protein